MAVSVSAGKSFEDDDVELICSKSGLEPLQALTDALAATDSAQEQQSLLQVRPLQLCMLSHCHRQYTSYGNHLPKGSKLVFLVTKCRATYCPMELYDATPGMPDCVTLHLSQSGYSESHSAVSGFGNVGRSSLFQQATQSSCLLPKCDRPS